MPKKQTKKANVDTSKYLKKDAAYLLAGACLLVGFFIGLNLSSFLGGSGSDNVTRLPGNIPVQVQDQQAGADSHVEFDRLRAAAEADPKNPEGWARLGHAYFDADHFQEAISAYERSLALDATNGDVWTDLGVMYRRAGNPAKAVESFDRALMVDPGHKTARFNKGIVLLHDLNQRDAALDSWRELLRMDPTAAAPNGRPLSELIREVEQGG